MNQLPQNPSAKQIVDKVNDLAKLRAAGWSSGPTLPVGGMEGEFFLNTTNNKIYKFEESEWEFVTEIASGGGSSSSWGGIWEIAANTSTPEIVCSQLFDDDGTLASIIGKGNLPVDVATTKFTITSEEPSGEYVRFQSNAMNFNTLPEMQQGRTNAFQLKLLSRANWSSFVGISIVAIDNGPTQLFLATFGVIVDGGQLQAVYDVISDDGQDTHGKVYGDTYPIGYDNTSITVTVNGTTGQVNWKIGPYDIPCDVIIPSRLRYSLAMQADNSGEVEGSFAEGMIVVSGFQMDENVPASTYDYCGSPIKQSSLPIDAEAGMYYQVEGEGEYEGTLLSNGDLVFVTLDGIVAISQLSSGITEEQVQTLINASLIGKTGVFTGNYNYEYPPSEVGEVGDLFFNTWVDGTVVLFLKRDWGWMEFSKLKEKTIPITYYAPAEFEESLLPLRKSESDIISENGAEFSRLALSNDMRTATYIINGEDISQRAQGIETFTTPDDGNVSINFDVELPRISGTGTDPVLIVKCGTTGGYPGAGYGEISLLSDGTINATGHISSSHSFNIIYPSSRKITVSISIGPLKTTVRVNGISMTSSSNASSVGQSYTPFIQIIEYSGIAPANIGKIATATMNVTCDDMYSIPDVFGRSSINTFNGAVGALVQMTSSGVVRGTRFKAGDLAIVNGNGYPVKINLK